MRNIKISETVFSDEGLASLAKEMLEDGFRVSSNPYMRNDGSKWTNSIYFSSGGGIVGLVEFGCLLRERVFVIHKPNERGIYSFIVTDMEPNLETFRKICQMRKPNWRELRPEKREFYEGLDEFFKENPDQVEITLD